MKGEHLEQEDDTTTIPTNSSTCNSTLENTTTTNIFPNYPHHPSFLSPPPHLIPRPQYVPHPLHHPENYEITPIKPTPTPPPPPSKKPKITPTSSDDGCTIETSYHPRGRPRGSKNKPKPPIIITRDPEPAMSPYILELPSGSDLVKSLTRFTHHRNVSICVFSATGAVKDVTLDQASNTVPNGKVSFNGKLNILSLSACIMCTNTTPFNWFSIVLASPNGTIVGGKVVGPLVCDGIVYVVATSFNSPTYTRLPLEVDDGNKTNNNQRDCYNEEGVIQSDRVTGSDGGKSSSLISESGGDGSGGTNVGLYSGHGKRNGDGSSEVLWAPTPLAAKPPETPY